MKLPSVYHPIFHGCLDWHSALHGHWLLARAANQFPNSTLATRVKVLFTAQFTQENVIKETEVFENYENFERTYGWSWLLKLQQELVKSPLEELRSHAETLSPLVDLMVNKYVAFLPTLAHPIRSGMHQNTAFGLIYPLEYDAASMLQEKIHVFYQRRCHRWALVPAPGGGGEVAARS